jgi:hypothetical protein
MKTWIDRMPLTDGFPGSEWDSFIGKSPVDSVFLKHRYLALDAIRKWNPVCYLLRIGEAESPVLGALVYERKSRAGARLAIPGVNTPVSGFIPADVDESIMDAALDSLTERLRKDYAFCIFQLSWRFPYRNLLERTRNLTLSEGGTTIIRHRKHADQDSLLTSYSPMRKRLILKALKKEIQIGYEYDLRSLEEFYGLYLETYRKQGFSGSLQKDEFLNFSGQIVRSGFGKLIFAHYESKLAAAALIVCDERFEYYLIGAYSEELKQTNAFSLLMHNCILSALEKGRGFDFEGSRLPGIRQFFESFGGEYLTAPVCRLRSGLAGLWYSRKFV